MFDGVIRSRYIGCNLRHVIILRHSVSVKNNSNFIDAFSIV